MKSIGFFAFFIFLSFSTLSQNIEGKWQGLLKVQGTELTIVFNISNQEDSLIATMDSPDQGAFGIAVQDVNFADNQLSLLMNMPPIQYEGTLNSAGEIEGVFKQGGLEIPMVLSQNEVKKSSKKRPQEPTEPFPYRSEDIIFENEIDGIKLAGTLTLPSKGDNFGAVVLISGSGPQDRNESLVGHKPFLVLSDYLTRQGIAVLRYDDRGTAESEGDFSAATSVELKRDVAAAVNYLRSRNEIDPDHIGLIGHSEGGTIAPMLAAESKDIAFIVLMAGTGIKGDKLLLEQSYLVGKASGMTEKQLKEARAFNRGAFDIVVNPVDEKNIKKELQEYIEKSLADNPALASTSGMEEKAFVNQLLEQLTSPWMIYFLRYDPAEALRKVECPVLAIVGAKDLQVPSEINLNAIETALEAGGNPDYEIKELPGLNHLFQEAETGAPSEYAVIEQTISPIALEIMGNWIIDQIN
jgi:pimeloyl-ACP methyl ester carboxylesterase